MKKKDIVKNNILFNDVINKGEKINTKYFVVCKMKYDIKNSLFGVAVGKKVGNAVTRNKIKRQIRNIIDNNKSLFENGYIYIIIGKKLCLNAKFEKMNNSLYDYLCKEIKNNEK